MIVDGLTQVLVEEMMDHAVMHAAVVVVQVETQAQAEAAEHQINQAVYKVVL